MPFVWCVVIAAPDTGAQLQVPPICRLTTLARPCACAHLCTFVGKQAQRHALVIGNNYPGEKGFQLSGCHKDVVAMEAALRRCGFDVAKHTDLDRAGTLAALNQLERRLEPGDTALFYFSGHGAEYDGFQFFVPCKMPAYAWDKAKDIESHAFGARDLRVALMDSVETGVKFIVADACRERKHEQIITKKGAGQMPDYTLKALSFAGHQQSPNAANTVAINSTGQAALAVDGAEGGVFTKIFAEEMVRPGVPLADVLMETKRRVREVEHIDGTVQVAESTDTMEVRFYFIKDEPGPPAKKPRTS